MANNNDPAALVRAFDDAVYETQKRSILRVMLPGLAVGVVGLLTMPALLWVASAYMAAQTIRSRQSTIPALRHAFNEAAAPLAADYPALGKISTILAADRQSAASWLREIDPRAHKLRTPVVAGLAALAVATANPALFGMAAFVMASSLLDQQQDYTQDIRRQIASAEQGLNAQYKALLSGRAP